MLEQIYQGFILVTQWHALLGIVFGAFLGFVMGAIPGLTGTMAVALIIPLTYYLPPVTAIVMLIAVQKGSFTSGSFPAILISTPGTPASWATVLDGYPLTKMGKAGKALRIAVSASRIGDFIGDLTLIFVAFQLAKLALKFGPKEYSLLIVFSLTIIASVSGTSILKGLVAAAIGLLIGTVGLDPIMSSPRFSFGILEFDEGFSLIPMLIGLLALPEVFSQVEKRAKGRITQPDIPISNREEDNKVSFEEFKSCLPSILRGSFIGVFIGSVPGIGSSISTFLSYSEAKRKSKTPELFGKGSLEGIAAAEAGNSAVNGPNFIPLLALGVPGDVFAAVLLSALMLQGLTPGPLLFQEHAPIVYGLFIGGLISTIIVYFIGIFAIRFALKVITVPKSLIAPIVLILCVAGSFAINTRIFDVYVMFGFGILGYIMIKTEYPTAPLLIAYILAPIGEQAIRQALMISRGNFLTFFNSPIAVFFLILTILFIIGIVRRQKRMSVNS